MNQSTIKAAIFLLIISVSFFGLSKVYDLDQKILKVDALETTQPIEKKDIILPRIPIFMYHHIDYFNDSNAHERFVTYIGTTSDKLRKQLNYIQELGYETITFSDIAAGKIPKKPIILSFDDSYDDFYTKAYPELQKRNMKAITYVITNNLNTAGYLTTDQIREMHAYGIEIASHTLTHADLPKLKDDELQKEIADSKIFLEKLINEEVLSFAYPFGKYNLRVRKAVEDAGYKYATTTNPGAAKAKAMCRAECAAKFIEPLDLQRYRVYSDTDITKYIY